MTTLRLLLLSFFCTTAMVAQKFNFESEIPATFSAANGDLVLTEERSKEGKQALLWQWTAPNSILSINESAVLNTANNNYGNRGGITLWIYNDTSRKNPLLFRFKDSAGNLQYQFKFNLTFTGWKACWISFRNMWSPTWGDPSKAANIAKMEIVSPDEEESGRIYIDRFNVLNAVEAQTIPDAQIPENNRFIGRDLWHWGWIWWWETKVYDIPMPTVVTEKERADMKTLAESLKKAYKGGSIGSKLQQNGMLATLKAKGIVAGGTIKNGVAPLVSQYDPQFVAADYNLTTFSELLDNLARGWYFHEREDFKEAFVDAMRWAIDQGFSVGSAMGTNHHYGYETRKLFPAVLWMKEPLREAGILDTVAQAVAHWSGLPESRVPYNVERDELCDSWNTLLVPRLISCLLFETEEEQLRALQGFLRWTSGSLCYTPGTIGGIKSDGTGFHHGGHYPAYSVPGYNAVGEVLEYLNDTDFNLTQEGREVLKKALLAASNFSNKIDWGLGVSGRHPLHASMNRISTGPQAAYARLALAFDPVDTELAETFLRIATPSAITNALSIKLTNQGFKAAPAPSGFFPYNHSCYGVFRKGTWMVGLKGYNKWVWGSEIYAKDNRYGRYQSYGSIQIIVGSELESRWSQSGWDWNRLPGTTTIHLPFDKLNSPLGGTLMAKSPEFFSGSTSLMGIHGMFATKIKEGSWTNFTPSHVARKSVFCVGNRLVCLGTGISNANSTYPTETTLFQQKMVSPADPFSFNGSRITAFPHQNTQMLTAPAILSDLTGNYYRVESGQSLVMSRMNQESLTDKTMAKTKDDFTTVYLNHGTSPSNAKYEYLITVQATDDDKSAMDVKPYTVLRQDNIAHIVEDHAEKVVGYALFDEYNAPEDRFILSATKEAMIMLQPHSNALNMSVCDPDINIGDASYTSPNLSQPKIKIITVKGVWALSQANSQVSLTNQNGNSILTVTCKEGLPVDFMLINSLYSSVADHLQDNVSLITNNCIFTLISDAANVEVMTLQGAVILSFAKPNGAVSRQLPSGTYLISVQSDRKKSIHKVVL